MIRVHLFSNQTVLTVLIAFAALFSSTISLFANIVIEHRDTTLCNTVVYENGMESAYIPTFK